tara:strand:+ start:312 stop:962 length:651 start_codon:yes stop_codon:yes gene_type:complete
MAETETTLQENQPDTDGEQNAGNEVSEGGSGSEVADELSVLLGEVEMPKQAVQSEQDESDLNSVVTGIQNDIQEIKDTASRDAANEAINDTVNNIIGQHDELKSVSKDAVEAVLHHEARKDQRIDAAFQKRHSQPEAWAKISKALGVKVRDALKTPDSNVTAAKAAARDAAQGISTTQPSGTDDGPPQSELVKEFDSNNGKIWDRVAEQTGFRRQF